MTLVAGQCSEGHIQYPVHPRCPVCGNPIETTIDLRDRDAEIITWTESTSTPPGVRSPNPLAIVEFSVEGTAVRAIGQLTDNQVSIGDPVRPVYVESLRDTASNMLREPDSQEWDGYRFEPVR